MLKCLLRSVASMFSKTRNLNLFHSAASKLDKKLKPGFDLSNFHDDEAWWFSKTDLSLYIKA